MIRNIILLVFATLLLTSCVEKSTPPNLLFILVDQQRADAIGISGNKILRTPNLDKLANEGVLFTKAYTQCAVCAPARATIMSGLSVENHGVRTNSIWKDEPQNTVLQSPIFDEVLHSNGYTCEYFGKWHCPEEPTEIYNKIVTFKEYKKYVEEHVPYVKPKEGQLISTESKRAYTPDPIDKYYGMDYEELIALRKTKRIMQTESHGVSNIPIEHTSTAFVCKQAIESIKRNKDKPFSITASINFPHAPMIPTEHYAKMYNHADMPVPKSIADAMKNSPYIRANGRLNSTEYANPELIKYMIANYYALVTEVDYWVGEMIETLEKEGLSENTLVIFTADHGEMLGSHGMREKNVFYEESARIPLMMKYPPEIESKKVIDNNVTNIDLFATILDYLNIKNKVPSDGESLRDLVEQKKSKRKDYIVTEWNYRGDVVSNYMILHDGWKLLVPFSDTEKVNNAMYNLNADPHEITNLLTENNISDSHKQKAVELRSYLLEWLEDKKSTHFTGVQNRKLY